MKLATAEEMRDLDRLAAERYGIPSLLLMETPGCGWRSMSERCWVAT